VIAQHLIASHQLALHRLTLEDPYLGLQLPGGGVARDVLARQRPLVLAGQIYALSAVAGGAVLVLLTDSAAPYEAARWAGGGGHPGPAAAGHPLLLGPAIHPRDVGPAGRRRG
jgi:hypothetical protein